MMFQALLYFTILTAASSVGNIDLLSPSAPEPVRAELQQIGLHYTISLNVGGLSFPRFILDTASSDFIIRTDLPPYNAKQFQTYGNSKSSSLLPADTKHTLYVDERTVTYESLHIVNTEVFITTNTVTKVGTATMMGVPTRVLANGTIVLAGAMSLNEDDWTLLTSSWMNSSGILGIGFPTSYDTIVRSINSSISTSQQASDEETNEPPNPTEYSTTHIRNNTWTELLLNTIALPSNQSGGSSSSSGGGGALAFSIDFEGDTNEFGKPTLWLGGIPSFYRSNVIWTEYNPIRPSLLTGQYDNVPYRNQTMTAYENEHLSIYNNKNDGYYRFHLYNLNFCNISIASNISTSWPVLLDSGAACLMLPSQLFDNVIAWLGDTISEFGKDVYILNTNTINHLPILSFQLKQKLNGHFINQKLYVPLSSLMYQRNKWMPPELCILKSSAETSNTINGLTFMHSQKIVFGSMVMKNFFFGIDMSNGRIALSNTKAAMKIVHESNRLNIVQCSKIETCIGQQTYFPPSNKCIAPNCNRFLFKAYNSVTSTCEWDSGIFAVFLIAIISIILVELNSAMGHRLFLRMTSATASTSSRSHRSLRNNNNGNQVNEGSEDGELDDDEPRNTGNWLGGVGSFSR